MELAPRLSQEHTVSTRTLLRLVCDISLGSLTFETGDCGINAAILSLILERGCTCVAGNLYCTRTKDYLGHKPLNAS